MSRNVSRFNVLRFLLTSTFIALHVALPAGAATIEEALKNIRTLPPAQRKAVIEENARKEGEVIWYTSMSLTDFPKWSALSKKRSLRESESQPPDPVHCHYQDRHRSARRAIRRGYRRLGAGRDVGVKAKRLFGTVLVAGTQSLSHRCLRPAGLLVVLRGHADRAGFQHQTGIPGRGAQSYQDLLLPKWRGKMNFGSDEYAWYSVMLDGMGKAKGLEFMKALARQQLHIPGSSSIMRVQLMLAGESAIAIAARGRRATEYKEKGAPIDYRILEPYLAEPNALALMRRSPILMRRCCSSTGCCRKRRRP